jgi:hypothetical protein
MVEKISKVSSTASSAATRIDHSVSIAEPDIAWVAERQSAINANLFSTESRHTPHENIERPAATLVIWKKDTKQVVKMMLNTQRNGCRARASGSALAISMTMTCRLAVTPASSEAIARKRSRTLRY